MNDFAKPVTENAAMAATCAKAPIQERNLAEMIIHTEGNLQDLLRHNEMLVTMIQQLDGTADSKVSPDGEAIADGWNSRFNMVTGKTSQALANQAMLLNRLAELTGLQI